MRNKGLFISTALLLTLSATASAQDKDNGEKVWDRWCAPCHATDPRKHPGTAALNIKYRGTDTPGGLLERTDLTPEIIAVYVREGVSIMPPSRKTEISDEDLADLSAFLTAKK